MSGGTIVLEHPQRPVSRATRRDHFLSLGGHLAGMATVTVQARPLPTILLCGVVGTFYVILWPWPVAVWLVWPSWLFLKTAEDLAFTGFCVQRLFWLWKSQQRLAIQLFRIVYRPINLSSVSISTWFKWCFCLFTINSTATGVKLVT